MMQLSLALVAAVLIAGCGSKSKKGEATDAMAATKTEAAATKETAQAAATSAEGKVTCTMKSDTRHIQVKKAGAGCELAYNKFGNEEVIATSLSGTDHCQKIADRIQANLKTAGFTCQ